MENGYSQQTPQATACGTGPGGDVPNSHAAAGANLSRARKIVRQPDRTDDEIRAACMVLRRHGDWRDDWIRLQIEEALAPKELEAF